MFCYFYLAIQFGCTGSQFGHVSSQLPCAESSSPTRDRTQAPCIGSVKSQPLDHQGSPDNENFNLNGPSSYITQFSFFFLNYLFIYLYMLGLCCGVQAFSSWGEQGLLSGCSAWASHCGGLSFYRAQSLWSLGFRKCSTQTQLPCGTWNLPGPGMEPVSPVLAGTFLTTGPPGKSLFSYIDNNYNFNGDPNIFLQTG